METIVSIFWPGESGILYGFWTPIYGFGVLLILSASYVLQKYFQKYSWKYYLALFFTSFFGLTVIELIGGFLIKYLFHEELWDYSDLPLHIGPYISVPVSFIWGIGSILLVRWIQPFLERFLKCIPRWITVLCVFLFGLDNIWTFLLKV